ncbi:MAG: NAD(P)-dependent oxidoreductase [Phycisphaeraceae bacterium]|nr:NAD(P)-dependent oxidoreductase [Phycisphaeraceae bacterium]
MKVLLTGPCGRIGPHTARALVEAGHEVRAVDRTIRRDLPVRVEVVDLLDRAVPYRVLEGCDAVVHLANHSGPHSADAQTVFNENVVMNANMFEAAAQLGVPKIIFASSVQAISGRRTVADCDVMASSIAYLPGDGALPACPGNTYGLSKQVGEVQLDYYCRAHGMTAAAVRFPAVPPPHHMARRLERLPIRIEDYHPGHSVDELFSFLPMNDAARLLLALVDADFTGLHTLFPACQANGLGWTTTQVIAKFYPDVPQRKKMDDNTPLVDNISITRLCGWRPTPPEQIAAAMTGR